MPSSVEFVALCRAQISLLTQGMGASLGIVYLTQELVEGDEAQLVPLVAYPEAAADWQEGIIFPGAEIVPRPTPQPRLLADSSRLPNPPTSLVFPSASSGDRPLDWLPHSPDHQRSAALVPQRQLMIPLFHEEVFLGLLMVGRDDRPWSTWEHQQIEQIATTLTLACVLDQRYQWLKQHQQQHQVTQAQQQDLLDNVLHQFRNSVTALQTFGKLLLKRLLPEDKNRSLASSILQETARLKDLSQQLDAANSLSHPGTPVIPLLPEGLQTVAIQADALPDLAIPRSLLPGATPLPPALNLHLEPCDLGAILAPLVVSADAIAQARSLTVRSDLPTDLPPVLGNAMALREVFNNVIENALKYTPGEGQVQVSVRVLPPTDEPPRWVEVAVSDTGPGIPPQDLHHLFQRHYRGIQAQSDIPGTGLGLAIARELMAQMQGQIEVISPARSGFSIPTPATPGTTVLARLQVAAKKEATD